jgi:hypothetical protein
MKCVQPEVIMIATDSLDSKDARSFSASKGGSNVSHQPAGVAILLILTAYPFQLARPKRFAYFTPKTSNISRMHYY